MEYLPIYERISRSDGPNGPIAEFYPYICRNSIMSSENLKCRSKWERDLGRIPDDQWKKILAGGNQVSVSPAQKMSYLMLLHRTYYTPKKLFEWGRRGDAKCPRCQNTGDLIHMIWKCPKLYRYWTEILDTINKIFKLSLKMHPKLCIMGVGERLGNIKNKVVLRCLFQAKKLIAQRWQAEKPPSKEDWFKTVTETIWKEKVVYARRGNLKEFKKIWLPWLEEVGYPM